MRTRQVPAQLGGLLRDLPGAAVVEGERVLQRGPGLLVHCAKADDHAPGEGTQHHLQPFRGIASRAMAVSERSAPGSLVARTAVPISAHRQSTPPRRTPPRFSRAAMALHCEPSRCIGPRLEAAFEPDALANWAVLAQCHHFAAV